MDETCLVPILQSISEKKLYIEILNKENSSLPISTEDKRKMIMNAYEWCVGIVKKYHVGHYIILDYIQWLILNYIAFDYAIELLEWSIGDYKLRRAEQSNCDDMQRLLD